MPFTLKDYPKVFTIFRFRERETHSVHLKNIEAELDAQMAKVEQQALAKAKREYENERLVLPQ